MAVCKFVISVSIVKKKPRLVLLTNLCCSNFYSENMKRVMIVNILK